MPNDTCVAPFVPNIYPVLVIHENEVKLLADLLPGTEVMILKFCATDDDLALAKVVFNRCS
jgi:hypothetical protein